MKPLPTAETNIEYAPPARGENEERNGLAITHHSRDSVTHSRHGIMMRDAYAPTVCAVRNAAHHWGARSRIQRHLALSRWVRSRATVLRALAPHNTARLHSVPGRCTRTTVGPGSDHYTRRRKTRYRRDSHYPHRYY